LLCVAIAMLFKSSTLASFEMTLCAAILIYGMWFFSNPLMTMFTWLKLLRWPFLCMLGDLLIFYMLDGSPVNKLMIRCILFYQIYSFSRWKEFGLKPLVCVCFCCICYITLWHIILRKESRIENISVFSHLPSVKNSTKNFVKEVWTQRRQQLIIKPLAERFWHFNYLWNSWHVGSSLWIVQECWDGIKWIIASMTGIFGLRILVSRDALESFVSEFVKWCQETWLKLRTQCALIVTFIFPTVCPIIFADALPESLYAWLRICVIFLCAFWFADFYIRTMIIYNDDRREYPFLGWYVLVALIYWPPLAAIFVIRVEIVNNSIDRPNRPENQR